MLMLWVVASGRISTWAQAEAIRDFKPHKTLPILVKLTLNRSYTELTTGSTVF